MIQNLLLLQRPRVEDESKEHDSSSKLTPGERIAAAEAEVRAAQEEMRLAADELLEVRRQVTADADAADAPDETPDGEATPRRWLPFERESLYSIAEEVAASLSAPALDGPSPAPSAVAGAASSAGSRASVFLGGSGTPDPTASARQETPHVTKDEIISRDGKACRYDGREGLNGCCNNLADEMSAPRATEGEITRYGSQPSVAADRVGSTLAIGGTTQPRYRASHVAHGKDMGDRSFLSILLCYVGDLFSGEGDDDEDTMDNETYITELTGDGTRFGGSQGLLVVT